MDEANDHSHTALGTLVDLALTACPGIEHAGARLWGESCEDSTDVSSDEVARRLDRLLVRTYAAPARAASDPAPTRSTVLELADLDADRSDLHTEMASLGVGVVVRAPIVAEGRSLGVLNLYATSRPTMGAGTTQLADLIADQAGRNIVHAQRLERLEQALASRTTIGIALGIAMQRFDLDETTAFAYLSRLSRTTEMKLRGVAEIVVDEHRRRARGEAVDDTLASPVTQEARPASA